jgi:membrane protein involved in D-alanine export
MTLYEGLNFFIVLFLGCIPAVVLQLCEKSAKKYILFFSLLMVFLVYREDPISLLYIAVYIFLEWHVIAIFQILRKKYGKNPVIYYHALAMGLLPLVVAKCAGLINHHWFSFLGISYVTFKVLQIIIESYDGVIEKSDFADTMSFLLFFPSLSSGPIDRSRRFESDLAEIRSRAAYMDMLQRGLRKILLGALYKFALSALAYSWLETISGRYNPQYVLLYAYIYGIYMFFDFAGYSLMAVGTGYILGIQVPDNFNKPFLSVDIKDFWNRWHISLSHWFRDFLFSRFMMKAIRKKWFKNRLNAASAGYIVNMLVMGVWHGLCWDYLLYGLYHGVLLALTERYQRTSWYKGHRNQVWYKGVSWFVTLNLVMFGFLIFSGYFTETVQAVIRVLTSY